MGGVVERIEQSKSAVARIALSAFADGDIENSAGIFHIDAVNLFTIDQAQPIRAGDFKKKADVIVL
ncbi:hypothetical protein D3C72_2191610 [compost metagenome]